MLNTQFLYTLLVNPKLGLTLSLHEWQNVIFVLREAKLLGSLYHTAKQASCYDDYPDYAQKHLFSAQIYAQRQAQQITFESLEIRALLEQVGVTAVFLKGAGYTLRNSLNGRGRVCSDIDILVTKENLPKAERHLKSNRWQSEQLNDYDEKYYRQWAHEIPPLFQINRATVLDMHHNVYLPISGRSPDIDLFLDSRDKTESGCFVLNPRLSLLHSIIHLFTNEDSSSWMRDLFDIYLLAKEFNDDNLWEDIIELGNKTNFQFEVYCCLKALEYYSLMTLDRTSKKFIEGFEVTKRQSWILENAILPAFCPEHSLLMTNKISRAKNLVYLRGHWIKMPLGVLIKHFTFKSFFAVRDQIVGKHHFDPKLPDNPNW